MTRQLAFFTTTATLLRSTTVRTVRFARLVSVLVLLALVGACSSSHNRAATATTGVATSAPPGATSTSTSTSLVAGCSNGVVTDAVRAALVAANGSPGGEAVPGDTYYGICGSTSYAVAHFEPAANAT